MQVNPASPQPEPNVASLNGDFFKLCVYLAVCMFKRTFNIEEPTIVLENVITQYSAIERTSTEEVERTRLRAYIIFAVTAIKVKAQSGS
jgi:hypothetical protein